MSGATLPGLGVGTLPAQPPGVMPATTSPAAQRKPGDNSQPTDFAAFLALASGVGLAAAGTAAAPIVTTAATAEDATSVLGPTSGEPSPLLAMLARDGRFLPPAGNSLPAAPLAAAPVTNGDNDADHGLGATIVAPAGSATAASGAASTRLPDALAPFVATPTQAAALPTRWMQTVLAVERDKTGGDLLVTEATDSVLAGDALLATANGARATPLPATLALPANAAQQPAFEKALGERLAWLVQEGRHDARIKLHPAELGSIDIRLSLDGDSTRISLASPHAAVRDALEQAVPRLRELLESAGLGLSQVNVGTGDARSQGDFGRPTSPSPTGREHFARGDDVETSARRLAIRLPQGLVDTFA